MELRSTLCLLTIAALCAVLPACTKGPDEKAAVEATQTYLTKNDFKAAVISAKSALQATPDNAELRRLLGLALLEGGDPIAAALELGKARELGALESKTVPALAKALLAQREAKQVLMQFASTQLDDAAASAELKTIVGAAHAVLGDRTAAMESALSALREWPQHSGAKLLQARLVAIGGDGAQAMALVGQILQQDPNHVSALIYRGDLERQVARDDEKALASYRAAAAARPDSVAAGAAIVSLLIEKRRLPEAATDLAKLKAVAPAHPETRLLEAQLAYLNKDFAKTREISAQLLKFMPEHPLLLQMAGDVELRLNSLGAAENYLTQAVKAAPRAIAPRLLLAQLYLRTGQATRTLETLQPILSSPTPDANSLSLAAQAYLQEGDAVRSEAMFAKAARQDPKHTMARTALALNKLSKGNADGGFSDLEAAAAGDAGHRADLALIAARLRTRDTQGALRAIDALEKKQPKLPLPHVLRGRVLLSQKDLAGATASFEKALSFDPLYYAATSSLAAIDLSAGKPENAQRRFEGLLKADPTSYRAALGLAELKARTGGSKDEVAKLIGDAARANPTEAAPRLALVKYLLQQQDPKRALAAAQEAHAALPGNTDVLYQLGVTQLASGQARQAVSTFVKLTAALPTRAQPELALADAHVGVKDYDAARRSLERALKLDPALAQARLGLARIALLQKRHDESIKIARSLQASTPKMAAAHVLEAEAEIDRGNLSAAVAPLRAAMPLAGGATVTILLHRTLTKLGRNEDADRLAATWRKEHPADPAFMFYLGDMALTRDEYSAAEAHYRAVVQVQPDNALALNNIAWLMTRQNKPGAVVTAEKANQLMPNRAPLMDTLAWALAHENQVPKAIELQKKAVASSPDDPGLKLTLAKIYLKAGDRERARAELDDLSRLGPRFPRQTEVTELMKALQ